MSTYTDVFGSDTIPPSGLGYINFALTADATFVWPYNSDGAQYPVAKVMDVACAIGNRITLPDAREVSPGEDFLIRNVGANLLAISDAGGTQISTVAPGSATYFYVTGNTTLAGTYGIVDYGVGTSTVDAASLIGYGIKAIDASLNQSHPVFPTATSMVVEADHRAKLIVFTGGAATFSLTSAAALGNDFFTMFRNEGTGTATIDPAAAELVDGSSSMQVQPGESLMLVCTGTQWYSVGYGRSVLYQFTQLVKDVSAGGTITLSAAEASNKLLTFIGNPAGAVEVVVPSIVAVYYVHSQISTAHNITLKTAAGVGVGISQGARIIALCDATNVVSAQSVFSNTTLTLADGSALIPSLAFATQTNTGLYKSGVLDVGVTVNGSTVGVFGVNGLQTGTIGANSTQRHTVPAVTSDTVALLNATQTLANKTISLDNSTVSGIAASSFVLSNASGNIDGAAAQKVIPSGAVVGTTDSQVLTNKTISLDNSTVSGIAASSFVLSNASGNIDGAAAQKVIPSGAVVGTTDSQVLTNKTVNLLSNVLSGTKAQFDTACSDGNFLYTNSTTYVQKDSATGSAFLPAGTTAQRTASPAEGYVRLNTDTNNFEGYDGTGWTNITGIKADAVSYLPAGTGAVATDVQSKLRESVSVLDFGAVGDGVADDTAAIQAAIDYAITSKLPLRGSGLNYLISSPLILGGASVSASGLKFYGEDCTITQVTPGAHGLDINGRSEIVVDRVKVVLPTDASGTGGYCLRLAGTTGWNRIRDCVFSGGRHAIYNNNTPVFQTIIEECRFYGQYGSHIWWESAGTATTISIRNCQGDGVLSKEPAYYFDRSGGSGNGIENLEITMCSADDCARPLWVRSRYLFINNFYSERIRGAEWEAGFRAFTIVDTNEPGFVHGLRCTFSSALPSVSDVALLSCNGQEISSCRLSADFSATSGQSCVITGAKPTRINNLSNLATGAAYGLFAGGLVLGMDNASASITVNPASAGTLIKESDRGGLKTAGVGSGNSTGEAGLVFGIAGYTPPIGAVSNGTFTAPVFSYSAILPYSPGGGVNRRGGLKVFVNPSSAGTTTPVNCATWDFTGHYVAGADNTYNLGSASLRWKELFAGTAVINTSDARMKQQDRALSEKERAVALKAKSLLKAFKYNDAVEQKGESARIHFGIYAQELQRAFEDEGLDPFAYAVLCHDQWDATQEQRDDKGNITQSYVPAGDRYGVRYEELLAFIIAAL